MPIGATQIHKHLYSSTYFFILVNEKQLKLFSIALLNVIEYSTDFLTNKRADSFKSALGIMMLFWIRKRPG
jgi:hypothetical protein